MTDKNDMPDYETNDLIANIRTYIPDFDMATEIMKRVRLADNTPPKEVPEQVEYALRKALIYLKNAIHYEEESFFITSANLQVSYALTALQQYTKEKENE